MGHWFDGLGMLNVFGFADGRVSYANRFFDARAYRAARGGRYAAAVSIATDPCRHLGQRLMALFDPTLMGEPHVNMGKLGEHYFGATETPCPLEFDPKTIETIGFIDLGHHKRDVLMTYSHAQFDTTPGEMTTVVTRLGVRNEHRIEAVDGEFRRRKVGAAPAGRHPEYMHSFAMTRRYVVLPLQPMTYSMPRILCTGR